MCVEAWQIPRLSRHPERRPYENYFFCAMCAKYWPKKLFETAGARCPIHGFLLRARPRKSASRKIHHRGYYLCRDTVVVLDDTGKCPRCGKHHK